MGIQQENPLSVLVIDDDESILAAMKKILDDSGYDTQTTESAEHGLGLLRRSKFDIVLCDLMMPGLDGLGFLKRAKEDPAAKASARTVIVMSAYGTLEVALEAMKQGAYDYISKPFHADELLLTLRKAEERERLRTENEQLKSQVTRKYSFHNIIARSESMMAVLETIKKIADYKTTVLVHGESGTGKELVAKAIHFNSGRKNKPFIAINCGAIPENLLESELFGHKRGAFTDATKDKKGLFEEANGGTLFLDEIGEMPLHLQVKLLRVLQENEIRPVGDSRMIPIDVRIVAATLRDIEQDVLDGRFRDDLFYRLNVISIHIPALRERKEDIPVLCDYFIERHRDKLGLPVEAITRDAMQAMLEHSWPGNIRELENCIERAMILTDGKDITKESLPGIVKDARREEQAPAWAADNLSIKFHTRMMEETLIRNALVKTGGNRTHAAKLLEISHRTLLYKLKEFNLAAPEEASEDMAEG